MIALAAIALLAVVGVLVWDSPLVREKRRQRQARRERAVIDVLAEHPDGIYGFDLHLLSGVGPGSLYPLLMSLEQRGEVRSWWGEPVYVGGPRRRYYALTEMNAGGRDA